MGFNCKVFHETSINMVNSQKLPSVQYVFQENYPVMKVFNSQKSLKMMFLVNRSVGMMTVEDVYMKN